MLNIGPRLWPCRLEALGGASFVLDYNRNPLDIIVAWDFATILPAIEVGIYSLPK